MESYQFNNLWAIEENWPKKPRETFDDVANAYLEVGNTAIARNVYYATRSSTGIESFSDLYDDIEKGMINKNHLCLDYGCGVGVATEILAQAGFEVEAMDLKDTPVLKFLEYRINQNGIKDKVKINPVTSEMPEFKEKYGFVIMLDVIEHLMNPKEILEEVLPRIIPGGHLHTNFSVMDFKGAEEGVHQHLKKISLGEFDDLMKKHRMNTVGTFLYQKSRGAEING